MNRSSIALLAMALATTFICLGHEPTVRPSEVRVVKKSMDFSDHLNGPANWKLGSAGTLTLKMDGDSTTFLINGDQEVFRLNAPEYIDEAVLSEDGASIVFVAMKSRGFGSDFAALVRVYPAADGVKVSRVLESGEKLFDARRWWISELGAVSNDGTRILAKFGVNAPDSNRMGYRWFTVELGSGKILSEGLTIENSKKPKKE